MEQHKDREQRKALIMKFGGTSVGSAERIRNVHDIVKSRLSRNPVVVVSAVGGITDVIISAAKAAEKGKPDASVIREKHTAILKELGLPEGLVDAELDELEECLDKVCSAKELTRKMLDKAVSLAERMS